MRGFPEKAGRTVKDRLFNIHDTSLNASSDLASEKEWRKKKIERIASAGAGRAR